MVFQFSTIAFILAIFILFYILPGKLRSFLLVAASMVFIYWQGHGVCTAVLLAITVGTWILGLLVSDADKNKALTILGGVGIAGLSVILFGWKYLPLLAERFPESPLTGVAGIAVPVGLSFYTFQAISYIADIIMGKRKARKNPIKFLLYMSWFPKWISGPIEREDKFAEQIGNGEKARLFDKDRALTTLSYLVWGLFLKMVIADRIGISVDQVFDKPEEFGAITLCLTSLLYTIQIYCDFAGYTNIAIGISNMFGISLTQNFRTPYLSENVVEFWRRWHISLSNIFRDYIYIPLGGNRHGNLRKAFNTLVVFFVCGIWHGAGLTFIIWGMIHGISNVIANKLRETKAAFLTKGMLGRVLTFMLVSFAWIFFRASDMQNAGAFIKGMFAFTGELPLTAGMVFEESMMLGVSSFEWWIVIVSLTVMVIMDVIAYRKKSIPPEVVRTDCGIFSRAVFFTLFIIAVMIFGKYGAGEEIRSFVYMQF